MGRLLAEAAGEQSLLEAWHEISAESRRNPSGSGDVTVFMTGAAKRIAKLSDSLLRAQWRPGPVHPIDVRKPGGGTRRLGLSAVADKIVEKAVLRVLDPVVDPELLPWSYAYRRGLGVQDAIRALAEARDDGATHVLRVDVRDCFGSIPRKPVLKTLAELIDDAELSEVVRLLVYRIEQGAKTSRGVGLHQGSPISPLLCNVYLDAFDRSMLAAAWRVIRYSDDIAVPLRAAAEFTAALDAARRALAPLHLELNEDKEQLATFELGVPFLGVTVTAQSTTSEEQQSHPSRTTVYVTRPGALLRTRGDRLVVEADHEKLLSVGWRRVRQVACMGRVGLTTAFLHQALERGVDVVLLSGNGRFDGRVQSPFRAGAVARHRQHLLAADPDAALLIARELVRGKIANMRTSLVRAARRLPTQDLGRVSLLP